jgi:DNA-binding transcriptional MerR regulator
VPASEKQQENNLTIEELAAETGMTVRNIRSHRARGLLPAPEVRDRVGYYGAEHLARLRMIQELQADGFNLKGIERLLNQNVGAGEGLDEALKRAVNVGVLVAVEEDRFEAPYPSLLDAAEGLVATGVSVKHALVVVDKVRGRCKQISHEFVRLFLEDVWKPFEAEGYPAERWPEVREALDRLRPLSLQALAALHRMTLSDDVERTLGKQLERMASRKG